MKPSEYFSSMEEVKKYVENYENILSAESYSLFKKIMGFGEQEGDFVDVKEIGKIDKSIVELIKKLNDLNFLTLSSCSGIKSEHKSWVNECSGYIAFHYDGNDPKKNIIKSLAEKYNLTFEEEEIFLKPSYIIKVIGNDSYKINIWNELLEFFTNRESCFIK